MSSGARWNEDYNDPESDIFRLSAVLHGQGTFDEFVSGCVREFPPGTVCRYNTSDTQALAALIGAVTGTSVAEYMTQKLLHPLGTTSPAHWLIDDVGREAAGYALNMTARDYARLGELYRNRGSWHGRQVVPESFVEDSITLVDDHTMPGKVRMSSEQWDIGYGYQWWLPEVDAGEFLAIGVYNQFIYVHPLSGSVIVKLSANRAYGTGTDEKTNRDLEIIELLRTIARSIA
jgi:CubicO group peptidase (beta-lactamase class C family)